MKRLTYLCLLGLFLDSAAPAWAVVIKTSDGNGADTELREDESRTRGGAKDLNTRWEISPTNFEIIALRFDLSGVDLQLFKNARLDMIVNRTGMPSNNGFYVYGLNAGVPGQDWTEGTTNGAWNAANAFPGLTYDGNLFTSPLNDNETTYLGSSSWTTSPSQGTTVSFTSDILSSFLRQSGGLSTLFLLRNSPTSTQIRFASKETVTLGQTGTSEPFGTGEFSPQLVFDVGPAPFNIFKWEYIDPNNPNLGKQESTTLPVDGYGLHAQPGLYASAIDLTMAYLIGAGLNGANLSKSNLSVAELSQSNLANSNLTSANVSHANLTATDLTGANLTGATLSGAILTDAIVKNSKLSSTHITPDQLYSTASYQNHDLTGVQFVGNDLSGANLTGQVLNSASFYAAKLVGANFTNANLTNAEFVNADLSQANLTGANLTNGTVALANLSGANLAGANLNGVNFIGTNLSGANIRGASLSRIVTVIGVGSDGNVCHWTGLGCTPPSTNIAGTGITLAQLASTASYGAGDLSAVTLLNSNFNGGNFAAFNLTNANFSGTTLVNADFSRADARGAIGLGGFAATNFIRPDGHIVGLNLSAGQTLAIRDYDGSPSGALLPIQVDQQLAMAPSATLRMMLEADDWGSTISFAPGIPVVLGGTLELAFADGVSLTSQVGRTFDLFDWIGVAPTGAFAIATPYVWDLTNLYTTGEVVFLAASGLVGDFNNDGTVDSGDYVVWRKGLGTSYTDAADNVWHANFGATLGAGSGSILSAESSSAVPEPNALFLFTVGLAFVFATRRTRLTLADRKKRPTILCTLLATSAMLAIPARPSLAGPPTIQLTKIGAPVWKPTDFQLFSAPATPFDATFGQVYNTLLPYDTPLATTYVPHAPPYDAELSAGALAGGYISQSVFTPDAITLHPNGVYFAYMLVPDPGINGSSRDFAAGPVIPNSLFPLAANYDVWLDGVLVDRAPGADAITPVQPRDVAFQGTSHLESLQAIWHPWDDDLTVGPLGNYDLRATLRDVGGNGWDVVAPFQVVPELSGDLNHNGTVDAADYVVWRKTDGAQAGYDTWRTHFGDPAGTGTGAAGALPTQATVPEPATLMLMIFAAAGGCVRRGRAT